MIVKHLERIIAYVWGLAVWSTCHRPPGVQRSQSAIPERPAPIGADAMSTLVRAAQPIPADLEVKGAVDRLTAPNNRCGWLRETLSRIRYTHGEHQLRDNGGGIVGTSVDAPPLHEPCDRRSQAD